MGMHWKHPLMADGWKVQLEATNKGVEIRIVDEGGNVVPWTPDTPSPACNLQRAIKRAVSAGTKKEQETQ